MTSSSSKKPPPGVDESDSILYLQREVRETSTSPGVYLFRDEGGDILYVGKAANLKKRLASYFSRQHLAEVKTRALVKKTRRFETIITRTEKEALILESNLIKKHRPRYNVILKDDKRYPSLRLDSAVAFPHITIVRRIKKDGALYFGPYSSATAVRQTLKFINKTFKLRKCGNRVFRRRSRPCLNYQIGTCLAPCCLQVSGEAYDAIVKEVVLFLKGRTPELVKSVARQMQQASLQQAYEQAATLRDKLFALQRTLEKQVVVTTDFMDRDIVAIASGETGAGGVAVLIGVRGGFMQATRSYPLEGAVDPSGRSLSAFIRQYYAAGHPVPDEILTPLPPTDKKTLEEWLSGMRGRKARLLAPRRGEKRRLVEIAVVNAKKECEAQERRELKDRELLTRLQKRLRLKKIPVRIECYDISNLYGRQCVASGVSFCNARADKSNYRTYRMRSVKGPDDYAAMKEVLERRLCRRDDTPPLPDLLIVDGGKGQLNIALAVLDAFALEASPELISIAKMDERRGETMDKIFKPGQANPVAFGRDTDLLLFLQRIRDEAHRFAIGYHRRSRGKQSLRSILDDLHGIGPVRKKRLLESFGSLEAIRRASGGEISRKAGIPMETAERIARQLRRPAGDDA